MKLSGNTILITGGATGIGYAFAEAFVKAGNKVIICGRRQAKLFEAMSNLGRIVVEVADLTKEKYRKSLVRWLSSEWSSLNVLVNNAGIQREIDFTKGISDFKSGENEISINLEAPIILTGMLIPLLTGNKEAAIINVSSGLGFIPAARAPVYSATKAGIHAYSMALRHQLSKTGIKVFEVIPPAVDTDLNPKGRGKRSGYKPGVTPGQFVSAVFEGLRKDTFEIGYGMTEDLAKASREELDRRFQEMNSRW